jgi:hypothetical protein
MEEEDRQRVWVLYGWFSGLMCLGSVFGAITWGAYMQNLVAFFNTLAPGLTPAQHYSFDAQGQYWSAAFYVTYAVEFLCMSVAKLLVLHRMADFSMPKGDGVSRRLAVGGRVVMAAVVVSNVAGLCGNVAAAVYFKQSSDLHNAASTANNTDAANLAIQKGSIADNAVSVQQFCEVAVLLIIILAFAVVGIASARRLSAALRSMSSEQSASGRQLRRQILGTTAFVFVTFLLRAAFSILNALANGLQNDSADEDLSCANCCNPAIFNVWAIVQFWLLLTPEFQLMVELISSPLALLVALWGMTSERALQAMRNKTKQTMVTIGDSVAMRASS